jgi:hypothetical protein
MKIKNLVLTSILLLATAGYSLAMPIIFPTKPWNATLKIIGEDGQPISNADISIFYTIPPMVFPDDSGKYNGKISGITDANGLFSATHIDRSGELRFQIHKVGYYSSDRIYRLDEPEQNSDDRNISLTLVLKKIGNPIPMYAKWVNFEPPAFKKTGRPPIVFNQTIGYDLIKGDWVAPYGKGANTDIIFTEEFNKKSISDFGYKLTISFPNTGDGIQEFTLPDAEKGSGLRSPHEVPADGYQSQLIRENFHHPGQPGKSDYDVNRNYFFRIHTGMDENGNIKSALYGKIYGDPEQMNFFYYLNPTPDSRNIEFNPKQNLMKDLKSFEVIKEP